jgi:hypothetical protein
MILEATLSSFLSELEKRYVRVYRLVPALRICPAGIVPVICTTPTPYQNALANRKLIVPDDQRAADLCRSNVKNVREDPLISPHELVVQSLQPPDLDCPGDLAPVAPQALLEEDGVPFDKQPPLPLSTPSQSGLYE